MRRSHADVPPGLQPERARAFVRAEREQPVDRDDVPLQLQPARGPLELAQLLERVDADVRVRADADADAALADAVDRREAVTEVRFGRRADADACARVADQ